MTPLSYRSHLPLFPEDTYGLLLSIHNRDAAAQYFDAPRAVPPQQMLHLMDKGHSDGQ
jgi:hypothetical protein